MRLLSHQRQANVSSCVLLGATSGALLKCIGLFAETQSYQKPTGGTTDEDVQIATAGLTALVESKQAGSY